MTLKTFCNGARNSIRTFSCSLKGSAIPMKSKVILSYNLEKKEIKEIVKNEVKQTEIKKGTGMAKVKILYE
jgi:hypothetical protein